jgi:hypothetical protein
MKNRLLLTLFVVACFGSTAFADEATESWMDYMVGTWTWKTPDGGVGELTFAKDKNAPVLIGHGKAGTGTWLLVWGLHKDTGEIVEHAYNDNGGHGTTRFKPNDQGDLIGSQEGWSPDGNATSKKRLAKTEGGGFTYYQTDRVVGDAKQEDVEVAVKRKQGE